MLDYNYVMIARQDNERRVQELMRFRNAQARSSTQPSRVDRLLFRAGEFLEGVGAQLKARYTAAAPLHQGYQSGHAG